MAVTQTASLKDQLEQALLSGAAVAFSYDELIQNVPAASQGDPVIYLTIDNIDPTAGRLSNLAQLAVILSGENIAALIPNGILPAGDLQISNVLYTLYSQSRTIGSISCDVDLSNNGSPLTWTVAAVNGPGLVATLQRITFTLINPGQKIQSCGASVVGSVDIGGVLLDVIISFPDFQLLIEEPPTLRASLAGFFKTFNLPTCDFVNDLTLDNFYFSASPRDETFETRATLETADQSPYTLLTIGGKAILGFDSMWFAFAHAPGNTIGQVGGSITVLDKLVVNSQAMLNMSDGSWSFEGDIDVPATWLNVNPGQPFPTPPAGALSVPLSIGLADFADIFVGSSAVPTELDHLGIAVLQFTYTHGTGSTSYELNGVFDGTWTLAGAGLEAVVSITLGTQQNAVSADFDLDGVVFTLSYTLGNGVTSFDASLSEGDAFSLSGHYDTASGIVSLTFDKALYVDTLLAWIVGRITGNRYFTLPEPWDDLLAKVDIPQGTSFTIDTHTKKITFSVPASVSFCGFSLTGLDITYDPAAKASGGSGLSVQIKSNLPASVTNGQWDPGTQSPPAVPGSKASQFDLKMVGAGQHIGFATVPTTIDGAVQALSTALSPKSWTSGYFPKNTMAYGKDIGWLVETQATLLKQINLGFIFNDPLIYGLHVVVSAPPAGDSGSPLLMALKGLDAEIMYRKVSDTVGVYSGKLTLPDSIRKINLQAVEVVLPFIAVDVYTNGDFKFDIGFPYNRDFSQSCSVSAGEYTGAGGFYYAKLDGLDPSEIPQIDPSQGVFSPITEFGIGFEIGVQKGFSSGPLSASLSVMLQGIFEGVFAKYTEFATGGHDEYFSVKASVAIVGHLSGSLDFVIISATLDVTVYVEVDVTLIAYRESTASVSVGVSVRLTVTINCGLFKIHIHCSFSTTVHAQTSFGQNGKGLWESHQLTSAFNLAALALPSPALPGWQPITDTVPLTLYLIPQLTAGDPTASGAGSWIYVAQLGLSNAVSQSTGGDLADGSYAHLLRGLLRWALYAAGNTASKTAIDAATADAKTLTQASVSALLDTLSDASSGAAPTWDVVQAEFKAGFQTTLSSPKLAAGASSGELTVGFFPALPGMTFSMTADGTPLPASTATSFSTQFLRNLKTGDGTGAPTSLQARGAPSPGGPSNPDPAEPISHKLIVDFVMLAIRSGLQTILDAGILPADQTPKQIKDILSALSDDALDSISGMTSRFMLHGTRLPQEGAPATALEPLYTLTGQQIALTPAALKASVLAMELQFAGASPADWGLSFAGGGTSLSIASTDSGALLFAPASIPSVPSWTAQNVQAALSPPAAVQPKRFALTSGILDDSNGPGLWRFPKMLVDHLRVQTPAETFKVTNATTGKDVDANILLTVDFRIRRIPDTSGTGKALPNSYEVYSVNPDGLDALKTILQQSQTGAAPVSGLSLAYASAPQQAGTTPSGSVTARKAVIVPIDFAHLFLVQSNFSTESHPPQSQSLMVLAAVDPTVAIQTFLSKLWTAGVTNTGGYFLFAAPFTLASGGSFDGLPDSLFDASGVATVTLVANLASISAGAPISLPSYANAVSCPTEPVGGADCALYVSSASVLSVKPLLPAGCVGVDITCDVPSPSAAGSFASSLANLFHLISVDSVTIDGAPLTRSGLPPVFGPLDPDDESVPQTQWHYTYVAPLVEGASPSPSATAPDPALNPYQYIGKTVAFGLNWTDIFGNIWGPVLTNPLSSMLAYADPLIPFTQLPYLAASYTSADVNGVPAITLALAVTLPAYATGEDTRKANDLASYASVYYQLSNGQVTTSLSTTLFTVTGKQTPCPVSIDTTVLLGWLGKVYAALAAVTVGGAPPSAPLILTQTITVPLQGSGGALNSALLFELGVSLTFTRTGPVAKGLAPDGPAATVSIDIAPQTLNTASNTHALTDFADTFEQTFRTMNWAVTIASGMAVTQSSTLMVMAYGTPGISLTIDPGTPSYFAPRPLANTLTSRTVTVQKLDANGMLIPDTDITVTDIDLDNQMQKFLSAFDTIFSADRAIPAALLDGSTLTALANSKKAIVEKLVGYVTDLSTGASYDPSAAPSPANAAIGCAADRYRQECLTRLSAFYDMNAVAVVMATTTFQGGADPGVSVQGRPVVPATTATSGDPEFSLTTGKVNLSTTASPMALGVFAKHTSDLATYAATPSFQIDAFEYDIETLTLDGTPYKAGSWFSFIKPRDQLAMPALAIPIPLRAFPDAPHLTRQFAAALIDQPSLPTQADQRLQLAKSWSLNGSYQHDHAAQDTIHLDVKVNIGLDSTVSLMSTAPQKDLLDALVEFNRIFTQIETLFTTSTPKLSDIRTPEQAAKAPALQTALVSLATLVSDVETCSWTLRAPAPTLRASTILTAAGTGLAERESHYTLMDGDGAKTLADQWQSLVSTDTSVPPSGTPLGVLPQVLIDGYITEVASSPTPQSVAYRFDTIGSQGTYLTAGTAITLPDRTIAIGALNIIDRQNGLISMSIVRNESLPASFRYATPWVTYTEILSPVLDTAVEISIADLPLSDAPATTPRPLTDHMVALFNLLLEGTDAGTPLDGSFQMTSYFEYAVSSSTSGGFALPAIELPIDMRLPTSIQFNQTYTTGSPPAFITALVNSLTGWMTANGISSASRPDLWPRANLRFDLSLFSSVSQSGRPILRLRRLIIPCSAIT